MKKDRLILLLSLLLCLGSTGCAPKPFSAAEKRTIGSQQEGIMRLWTIDNPGDSLFLRKQARKVTPDMMRSEEFRTLCQRMLLTVQDSTNPGVGIAAPQVGIPCRLIAVQRFDKPGEPFELYANPEILHYGEKKVASPEGCLSVPGRRGTVSRSDEIQLQYTDPRTESTHEETIKGFTAIIFQHETDHLDGTLYIDKLIDEPQQ